MQIDWLTVAAQIVNFLVLVWLLQRFLYKPITNAMRRREERIEDRLADARAAREDAEGEKRTLQERQAELEESKEETLKAARKEAEDLRERLEAELRDEMEQKRESWRDQLAEERDALIVALQRKAGRQVLDITERVLADYADTDVAERVVATFAAQLEALEPETRKKMTEASGDADEPATVHTGTELDSAAKEKMTRAIHEILSTDIEIDYREDPDMVFGARLTIGDYTVEWSAVRYLRRLEAELSEIIDAGTHARDTARDGARAERAGGKDADARETA